MTRETDGAGQPVAALNMYDWPGQKAANQALWDYLRDGLRADGFSAPQALSQEREGFGLWQDPALIFAQTCGYPYYAYLQERVALVATPCYAVKGCEGPRYRSAIVVRADSGRQSLEDCRGALAAATAEHSMSGYHFLMHSFAGLAEQGPVLRGLVWTGGHARSIEALCDGRAEVAAIDCVSWHNACRDWPERTAKLKVIAWSALAPGLPLVTSREQAAAVPSLRGLLDACPSALLEPLSIQGFEVLSRQDYQAIGPLSGDVTLTG